MKYAWAAFTLLLIGPLIATAPMAQAQTYSVIHSFTSQQDEYPFGVMVIDSSGNLYGAAGHTTVYSLSHKNSGWAFNLVYTFPPPGFDGVFPLGVNFGPNGTLFGTTWFGGLPDCSDGSGCGVVFNLTPPPSPCKNTSCQWTNNVLYRFTNQVPDGSSPNAPLAFDAAGNVYGTTNVGGEYYYYGMVYALEHSSAGWRQYVIYSFTGLSDGANPAAGLISDPAGNLYGTTSVSGDPNCDSHIGCGTVFQLSPTSSGWVEHTLYTFHNGADGYAPSNLTMDRAGNIYGTTLSGGSGGGGTAFELVSPSWTYKLLASFTGPNPPFSMGAIGPMAIDANGSLYGATESDGAYGAGNVFKLTPADGNAATLHRWWSLVDRQ